MQGITYAGESYNGPGLFYDYASTHHAWLSIRLNNLTPRHKKIAKVKKSRNWSHPCVKS